MECNTCREILSARLDGEDRPGEAAAADAHLARCAACAQWWEDAASVTRLARLCVVRIPEPASGALDPQRLALAAPGPGPHRVVLALRWLLGLLGLAQFLLGIAQISVLSDAAHQHGFDVSPAHLWHESAAWNIAVGAGFGWIALRRTRPHALLPLLTAFVAMLTLLSLNDMLVGTVDGARLVSHAFVVVGYLVLVALSRPRFDFGDPPADRQPRPLTPVSGDGPPRPVMGEPGLTRRPPLRLVTRTWPVPALRWDRAA